MCILILRLGNIYIVVCSTISFFPRHSDCIEKSPLNSSMHLFIVLPFLSIVIAAPLLQVGKAAKVIPGQYIVKLKHNEATISTNAIRALKESLSVAPKFEYSSLGFHGFAGSLSATEIANLQASEHVCYTSENKIFSKANHIAGRIYTARRRDACIRPCLPGACHMGPQSNLAQAAWRFNIRFR